MTMGDEKSGEDQSRALVTSAKKLYRLVVVKI